MLYKGGLAGNALLGEMDMTAFGFHNPKHTDFGADGDGVSDDRAAFSGIDSEMAATGGLCVVDHGTYKLGSNLTLQAGTGYLMQPGALLSPDAGVTLTVNASILAGAWQIFAGAGTISGKMGNEEVLAKWFGIDTAGSPTGSGKSATALLDNATALQKALDYCSANDAVLRLLPGEYIEFDRPIYFYGGACIVGSGRDVCGLVLDADPEVTQGAGYSARIINVGLTGIPDALDGSDPQSFTDWTGVCRDVSFHVTSNGPDNCALFDIAAVSRGEFYHCLFDFRDRGYGQDGATVQIVGDGNWHTSPLRIREGLILAHNLHLMKAKTSTAPDGASPGGINLTYCHNTLVIGDVIETAGDDACIFIGDEAKDNLALGVRAKSVYGRQGTNGGERNLFINCTHEHVAGDDASWEAANGFVAINTSAASKHAKSSGFIGCNYKIASGPGALVYGAINLNGSQDCFAHGCVIHNDDTSATVQCTSSIFILGGWSDPEGIEGDSTMRSHGHHWVNNRAQGAGTVLLAEGGLVATDVKRIVMEGNAFDSYSTTGLLTTFSATNRQRGRGALAEATFLNVHGYAFTDQVVLGEWLASAVAAGATTNAAIQGGSLRLYPAFGPILLTMIEATADPAPTADSVTVQVKKNGSNIAGYAASIAATEFLGEKDARAIAGRLMAAGDYLEVDVTGGGALSNTPDVVVRLYGVRMQ